jgi:hypothetical protein
MTVNELALVIEGMPAEQRQDLFDRLGRGGLICMLCFGEPGCMCAKEYDE